MKKQQENSKQKRRIQNEGELLKYIEASPRVEVKALTDGHGVTHLKVNGIDVAPQAFGFKL